jgi:hypothetical protein
MLKHIRSPLPSPSPRLRNESLTGVLVGPFWGTRLGRRQSDSVISLYMPSRVVNCVFMSSRLPAVESPLPPPAGAAAMTPARQNARSADPQHRTLQMIRNGLHCRTATSHNRVNVIAINIGLRHPRQF